MQLLFERGDRDSPAGHALIYFRADDGAILATYVSVPAIAFDLNEYLPGVFASAMGGMDLSSGVVATPLPPVPKEVTGIDFLHALADRRRDDLIYAGATMKGNPMQMMQDAAMAAQAYGELYSSAPQPEAASAETAPEAAPGAQDQFGAMTEGEQLNELTTLTGRLRDSLNSGSADPDVERQMEALAHLLPAKYRGPELVEAARTPGERGQRLAALYLERSYKLFNEDYLDLERIDREIDAVRE